jgi:hypothetical protein
MPHAIPIPTLVKNKLFIKPLIFINVIYFVRLGKSLPMVLLMDMVRTVLEGELSSGTVPVSFLVRATTHFK